MSISEMFLCLTAVSSFMTAIYAGLCYRIFKKNL